MVNYFASVTYFAAIYEFTVFTLSVEFVLGVFIDAVVFDGFLCFLILWFFRIPCAVDR